MCTAEFVTHVATSLVCYIAMQLLVTLTTAAHCRSLLCSLRVLQQERVTYRRTNIILKYTLPYQLVLPAPESCLRSLKSLNKSRNFPCFMKPEASILCTQNGNRWIQLMSQLKSIYTFSFFFFKLHFNPTNPVSVPCTDTQVITLCRLRCTVHLSMH